MVQCSIILNRLTDESLQGDETVTNFTEPLPPLYKGATDGVADTRFNLGVCQLDNRTAEEYWQDELVTRDPLTRQNYLGYFRMFQQFVKMNSDQLLSQRIQDQASQDKKIQRRAESMFRQFLAHMREKYAPKTLQNIYASVRSFYEIHEYPLIMRKNDYPKGDSNGSIRATREAIQKAIETPKHYQIPTIALIMTAKDSGLRVSDLRLLKCRIILENPEAKIISLRIITEKTNLLAKTFLGEEAINAIKKYLEMRKKGSPKMKPEEITGDSPLFRTWQHGEIKPMSRQNICSIIKQTFVRIGERKMSAHSLRKALQTNLEKGKMPTNWIDQVLGHELLNIRDAYSLPTDEELKEAYEAAYKLIRVYPEVTPIKKEEVNPLIEVATIGQENLDVAEARNMTEVKALLSKGY